MEKIDNKEFAEYLAVSGEEWAIEERLRTVANMYMNEAQYLVGLGAKLSQVQRDYKLRKAELYGEFRQLKAADKSWTETAIEAAINADESIAALQSKEAELETAVALRKFRLEALKMLNSNIQLLCRSILNEKYGVQ